jgi:hypothetical protein
MISAIGTILLSLVGGGAAGALVTWWLRTHGEVVCEVEPSWSGGSPGGSNETRHFRIKLQNRRDVDVGIWNVRVAFSKEGQEPREVTPSFADTGEPADVVHLPSRVPVSRVMVVTVGGDFLQAAKEADKTEVVMTVIREGERREHLPRWDDI